MPAKIDRVFLLVICALAFGLAFHSNNSAALAASRIFPLQWSSFVEESLISFQENSVFSPRKLSRSFWKDTFSVGRWITANTESSEWPRERVFELSSFIVGQSRDKDISPFLVLSMIEVESSFSPKAVSPKGAIGLMQILPSTAREVAGNMKKSYGGPADLEDPKLNIELGIEYMRFLKAKFPSPELMLAAYNMGPSALELRLQRGAEPPRAYFRKVMRTMETLKPSVPPPEFRKIQWL